MFEGWDVGVKSKDMKGHSGDVFNMNIMPIVTIKANTLHVCAYLFYLVSQRAHIEVDDYEHFVNNYPHVPMVTSDLHNYTHCLSS